MTRRDEAECRTGQNGKRRTLLRVLLFVSALLGACDDGNSMRRTTPPRPDAPHFPVVLESDTRVAASADGSRFTEEPVAPAQAYAEPAGHPHVLVRDGEVTMESDDSRSAISTGISTDRDVVNALWSPDGARLMFGVSFGNASPMYVVGADGRGLVDVVAGLDGDAFPVAWAADGNRLAFGIYGGHAPSAVSTLYTARPDGSERAALGEFTNPQGDGGWDRPQFSPDGSSIVAFGPAQALSLRIFDADVRAPVDIEGEGVTKFTWSPDGRSIAFDTFDAVSQRSTILTADAATGKTHTLTHGSWPRWSPAGDRIAFKRAVGDAQLGVRTIRIDGSDDVPVGPTGYYAFPDLYWSDDGSAVSFTRPAFGPAQLYRVDLANGRAEALGIPLGEPGNPPRSVSLSPDEDTAVFLQDAFRLEGGWYVQNLATGETTLLAGGGFPFNAMHWTDDGPTLAAGGPVLTVIDSGETTPRPLGLERVFKVSFAPDGSVIAAITTDGLWIVDTDGSDRRRIVEVDPDNDIAQFVDWAPDGRRLAYVVTHADNTTGLTATSAFVADLQGNRTELTPDSGYGGLPYWSPDGRTLAQVRAAAFGATRQIWLMRDDGGGARILASLEAQYCDALYWSPDGSRIAVSSELNTVSLIDVATDEVAPVVTTGGGCNAVIVGWSSASDALYVYPACYFGI